MLAFAAPVLRSPSVPASIIMLCAVTSDPALPSPPLVGRRALLQNAALAAPPAFGLLSSPGAALAEASGDEVIVTGQLQFGGKLPPGATATVTGRVVGRNTKGPLASVVVSDLDSFPRDFTISRADFREVPDFVWLEEDIYLRADVEVNGKKVLRAVSKAKAVAGDGSLASRHKPAALELS